MEERTNISRSLSDLVECHKVNKVYKVMKKEGVNIQKNSQRTFDVKDFRLYGLDKGFTLIELMVSVSIFSVVMLIVIGALITLNNANQKAQAIRAVVDNLNFAMEDVTRNVRTGGGYKCGLSVNLGGDIAGKPIPCSEESREIGVTALGFKGQREQEDGNPKDVCYFYGWVKDPTTNTGTIKYAKKRVAVNAPCDWSEVKSYNLVSPEVDVRGLKFYVFDRIRTTDTLQPFIIITLGGNINSSKYNFSVPFNIQTTVSQRSSGLQFNPQQQR